MNENKMRDNVIIKLDGAVQNHNYSIDATQQIKNDIVNPVEDHTFDGLIEIKESSLVSLILGTYGDPLARNILMSVAKNPKTIIGILDYCGMPQTTGYRKCLSLVETKFLVPCDTVRKAGRSVTKYLAAINTLQIQIKGNDISVKVEFSDGVPWK
jgi:hypothetical protein